MDDKEDGEIRDPDFFKIGGKKKTCLEYDGHCCKFNPAGGNYLLSLSLPYCNNMLFSCLSGGSRYRLRTYILMILRLFCKMSSAHRCYYE